MQGSQLKQLAKVCDLTRIDLDPNAPLLLQGTTDSLAAHYRGSYSSAYATTESNSGELDIIVSAKQFRDAVAIFDADEYVEVSEADSVLVLQSPSSRFRLRSMNREADYFDLPEIQSATIKEGLAEEVGLASKFAAKSMAQPIYTGIRLLFMPKSVRIEAYDGYSMIYHSRIVCKGPKESTEVIVPAYDFELGLQITGDKDLIVTIEKGKIIVVGNGAGFDCATLTGKWADIPVTTFEAQSEMQFPATTLSRAVSAAKFLETNTLRFAASRANPGTISISTKGQTGDFTTKIDGKMKGNVSYGVEALALISSLGKDITFHIAKGSPLYAKSGRRQVWLTHQI